VEGLAESAAFTTDPVNANATAVASIAPAILAFFIAEASCFARWSELRIDEESDLKITFAWFRALLTGLSGLDLHALDFVVDFIEPMLKFRRFDFHADLAALADDMSFAGMFEFPHQQRILETALRAGNDYCFVFKHFHTSQHSYKVRRRSEIPQSHNTPGRRRLATRVECLTTAVSNGSSDFN
jgi:hypothetical protein